MSEFEGRFIPPEAQESSKEQGSQEEILETSTEDQTLAASEKIQSNDSEIEHLLTQVPSGPRRGFTERFQGLQRDMHNLLQRIEVNTALITGRAFLPDTREKLSLIKKMDPHFQPRADTGRHSIMGSGEKINDIEKIQGFDTELLKKLADIRDLTRVDGRGLVNENYDFATMPGFVEHFKTLDNQEIRTAVEQLKDPSSEKRFDNYDFQHSALRFFIMNFDTVHDKKKLANFSTLFRDYAYSVSRLDVTIGGIPRGGSGIDDPKRLPGFLIENSQLELDDETLDAFFRDPDHEDKIGEFVSAHHPWIESLRTMLHVQGQAEKQEFNLWINDLMPLVKESIRRGIISFDSRADAEILLEYVKTFGMRDTPDLFEVFVNIKRAKHVGEIEPTIKNRVRNELGIDMDVLCKNDPKNMGLIINALHDNRRNLLTDFVNESEDLPDKLCNSKLSADIFRFVKGTSVPWKKKKGLPEILNIYQQTKQQTPELFRVPDGYERGRAEIPRVEVSETTDADLLKERGAVLTNPDLVHELARLREAASDVKGAQHDILGLRKGVEGDLLKALEQENESTKHDLGRLLLAENKNEKAVLGIKNKLEMQEKSHAALQLVMRNEALSIPDLLQAYQTIIPDKLGEKRVAITKMSLALFDEIMPGPTYEFLDSALTADDERFVQQSSAFLSHNVREHVLNQKHEPEIAGQLDSDVKKAIKRSWGLTDKNIVIESGKKLADLTDLQPTGKTRAVSFVPSKGLQRIFTGNIGSSCMDSREEDFAKGKFEGTTAYSLVLDEGKESERFAGSFLLIETKTEQGEPVLVIRANNPSENLFSTLDGDALNASIINQVRRIANARGIRHVGVPRTEAGKASSNREAVARYYQTHFADRSTTGLVKNEETNMNGYPIWDKDSVSAVVLI